MSYGYGGRAERQNPFVDQTGAEQPTYNGRQPYGAPTMGRDEYGGRNVELEPLTAGGYGPSHSPVRGDPNNGPNRILNECRDIDSDINEVMQNLATLDTLQQRALNDTDSSSQSRSNQDLDAMASETMTKYRNLADKIKRIKQRPDSGSPMNSQQVGRVDRKLKAAIQEYQKMDSQFQKKLREQMARQYRIVQPDASEAEVRDVVEGRANQQIFSQALLQSDRRGQSRSALSAVKNRHEAIQKIESQMIELAQLFQDMEALVVQQEAAVVNIEMKGEEVVDHMDKGNEQIGTAIKSARAARRKKWWCLGIAVLIVLIIVVVVIIVVEINKSHNNNKSKRFVLPSVDMPILNSARVIPGQPWTPSTSEGVERSSASLSGRWTKFSA